MILVPFALKFGWRPVYVSSTAIQCGISVWSAKMQTVTDLMLVSVLSCIVGALAEVLVQMTVAVVYFVHERGHYLRMQRFHFEDDLDIFPQALRRTLRILPLCPVSRYVLVCQQTARNIWGGG